MNAWGGAVEAIELHMADDEEQIRRLVERWAEAVHAGDMSGVLADHTEDIVMFDVPPPHEGVRGIDAYVSEARRIRGPYHLTLSAAAVGHINHGARPGIDECQSRSGCPHQHDPDTRAVERPGTVSERRSVQINPC